MAEDGKWNDYRSHKGHIAGSSIQLGPLFQCEVYHIKEGNFSGWTCSVNGQRLSGYPTMAAAKARADWEMWNRIRQAKEGYGNLMARKLEWEDGGNKYRSPEYLGLPG